MLAPDEALERCIAAVVARFLVSGAVHLCLFFELFQQLRRNSRVLRHEKVLARRILEVAVCCQNSKLDRRTVRAFA